MAVYSFMEFAEACGVDAAYLTMYLKREKIVCDDQKKFNTKDPLNFDFWNKRKDNPKQKKQSKAKAVKETKSKTKEKPEEEIIKPISAQGLLDMDLKTGNLEKKKIDIRIALLKEAQMRGENIPTADVSLMVNELSVGFIRNYKDSFDKFIIEIAHRHKMNIEEQARIKNEFIKILNETHKRVFDECKQKMKSILTNSKKSVKYETGPE